MFAPASLFYCTDIGNSAAEYVPFVDSYAHQYVDSLMDSYFVPNLSCSPHTTGVCHFFIPSTHCTHTVRSPLYSRYWFIVVLRTRLSPLYSWFMGLVPAVLGTQLGRPRIGFLCAVRE